MNWETFYFWRESQLFHFIYLICPSPTTFICQLHNKQNLSCTMSLFLNCLLCLIFWSLCETILHYKSLWRILLSAKIGQFLLLLLRLFSFLEDLENQLVKSTVRILIGIRMSNLEVNLRRVDFKCCLNFQKKSKKVHFTHSNTYPSFPLQKLPYAFPHELLVFQGPQRTKCFDRFFWTLRKHPFLLGLLSANTSGCY